MRPSKQLSEMLGFRSTVLKVEKKLTSFFMIVALIAASGESVLTGPYLVTPLIITINANVHLLLYR